MIVKMRAVVVYEWEENSENWPDFEGGPEDLLKEVQQYVDADNYYIFEMDASKPIEVEIVK